jgi:ABC-2 type transport system ATP-binding protein
MGIAEIRDLIRKIASSGKTIILASHLLDEVQKVCSDFAILKNGKKIYDGKVSELSADGLIEIGSSDMALLESVLRTLNGVKSIKHFHDLIQISVDGSLNAETICKQLIGKGVYPSHLIKREKSLEELFLQTVNEQK